MNAKDYALRRISDIRYRLEDQAKLKYLLNAKALSVAQKYKLIKTGKAKLRKLDDIKDEYHTQSIEHYFDFGPYDNYKRQQKLYNEACERIKEESQRVQDVIMIGEMKEALAVLEHFRLFTV